MMLCPELLVQGHMLLYVKGLKSGYFGALPRRIVNYVPT